MKKLILFFVSMLFVVGISAKAATSSQYNFNDYTEVADAFPGRLFSQFTKTAPVFENHNNVNCLKTGSEANSDNIVLMNSNSFKDGGFTVEFSIVADSAPKVNWGYSSAVLIRYMTASGQWKNDRIAEYAYDMLRVRDNNKEVQVTKFNKSAFNSFRIEVTRNSNVFTVTYTIDSKTYTKDYVTCDNGEICVGFFSYLGNALYLRNIAFEESYSNCPSAEEIKNVFKLQTPSHPRILMDGERLENIRDMVKTDDRVKVWYNNVKAKANAALTAPVSTYELRDGERLLYVSRDVYANAVYPAFVYLIEGGEKYINRTWAELSAAAEFPDWHPEHFLDTAEMTFAFAICYDWLYDYWNKETQLPILETAIKKLGLDAANGAYENTAQYDKNVFGAYHNRIGWKNDPSNWGLVCNGGIASGALAIMNNTNIDYCAKILEDTMYSLETTLSVYADDGAWTEGVGYWHYATQYLTYMMSSLQYTLGSTYGYLDIEGIRRAPEYLIAHTGPQGVFNYGDCGEGVISAPELFYLADYYDDGNINAARLAMMDRFGVEGSLDDILFYNKSLEATELSVRNSARFDSVGAVTAFNSTQSPLASYIAMKTGKVGTTHGDLDAGTFVLDALGVRWVQDYGNDAYTLPGYFEALCQQLG